MIIESFRDELAKTHSTYNHQCKCVEANDDEDEDDEDKNDEDEKKNCLRSLSQKIVCILHCFYSDHAYKILNTTNQLKISFIQEDLYLTIFSSSRITALHTEKHCTIKKVHFQFSLHYEEDVSF